LDGRRPVGPTLWAVPNFRVGVGANMPSQGIKNPVTDLDNYWKGVTEPQWSAGISLESSWTESSETASLSRTTNACESFHSHFSTNFYKAHPNIYHFTEILLNFQAETYVKINTANKFVKKLRPQVKQRQNFVLEKIKERNENRMSRLDFVKCISYKCAPSA
jgi:hypothetical protein